MEVLLEGIKDMSAQELTSLVLDLTPGIGELKGLLEVVTGYDLISDQDLGHWRWAGLAVGLGKAKAIGKITKNIPSNGVSVGDLQRQFWTNTTTFDGNKVYQRNDLIDPARIDSRTGMTNLELMSSGRAPIGPDGKPINLHHMTQQHDGAIAEMTATFHQTNSRTIHINPSSTPSGIDRVEFGRWRTRYWESRANDF